jgi:hypothetical protein
LIGPAWDLTGAVLRDAPKPALTGADVQIDKPVNMVAKAGGQKDISVLLVGNRLQITADVDSAGLVKLKDVLTKYEEILKLLQ